MTTPTVRQSLQSLRPGMMNNKRVKAYQQMLAGLGYYHGRIDGDYGRQTEAAVRQFQADRGLTADGHIGIGSNAETGPALEAAWSQRLTKPPNTALIDQVAALHARNAADQSAVADKVAMLNGRNLADQRALTQEGDRAAPGAVSSPPSVRDSLLQAILAGAR